MKKIKLLLCSAGILLATQQDIAAQVLPDTTIANALLWQVSGNGLKDTSYLYGTMHLFCKEDIVLPEVLKEKILLSKKIFFESSADKSDSSENNWLRKKYFAYDYNIRDVIGDSNFIKASYIINNYRAIAIDTLKRMSMLGMQQLVTRSFLGCDRLEAFDYNILAFAIDNGKKIDGLETRRYESGQSPHFPGNILTRGITKTWNYQLANLWKIKRDIKLYKEQKINDIYLFSTYKDNGEEAATKEAVLDERNKEWIKAMKRAMKRNPCLFAFGCAHLAGPDGIIMLLRKKGYTVTPVFY